MQTFLQKLFKFCCIAIITSFSTLSFSNARVLIKNFCDQPVTLYSSNEIECEPSGIEMVKKQKTKELSVDSGSIKVCKPLVDNGQSSYSAQPDQQDVPRELSPQSYDLPQGGELIWYCANSGSTGPCECKVPVQSAF